jgi:hypothetical protein
MVDTAEKPRARVSRGVTKQASLAQVLKVTELFRNRLGSVLGINTRVRPEFPSRYM